MHWHSYPLKVPMRTASDLGSFFTGEVRARLWGSSWIYRVSWISLQLCKVRIHNTGQRLPSPLLLLLKRILPSLRGDGRVGTIDSDLWSIWFLCKLKDYIHGFVITCYSTPVSLCLFFRGYTGCFSLCRLLFIQMAC